MTKSQSSARRLLNQLVRAYKLQTSKINMETSDSFDNIYVLYPKAEINMHNLISWCELLDMSYQRVDWEGNKACNSNYDEVSFIYEGIKFFELVEKENYDEGK